MLTRRELLASLAAVPFVTIFGDCRPVYRVTTGEQLREALAATGPRIVTFEVSTSYWFDVTKGQLSGPIESHRL